MNDSIKLAIECLYKTFENYNVDDFANVSCFDFGPDENELAGIKKSLREIPVSALNGMEFYDASWYSWGTENEVKYFLPRLLECIAQDITLLDFLGYISLFKYKLSNCFSPMNNSWSDEEKDSIAMYIDAILEYHLSNTIEIGFIIECVLLLGTSPQRILKLWHSDETLHQKQVVKLYNYFEYSLLTCFPKSVYLGNGDKIKEFLDLLFMKLTPEELASII